MLQQPILTRLGVVEGRCAEAQQNREGDGDVDQCPHENLLKGASDKQLFATRAGQDLIYLCSGLVP